MQPDNEEKNLERERLLFFCDAVIAIAITLLSFNLKVKPAGAHFTYTDIANAWHTFAAFFLSFIMIAIFWINHHRFYVHIGAVDSNLIIYNICWLLFIVLLPFTTSLISDDFFDKPAMVLYSANVLLVAFFQNCIWDYSMRHRRFAKKETSIAIIREYHAGCNIALTNAGLALLIAFVSPLAAFIILFIRTFTFRRSAQQYVARLTRKRTQRQPAFGRKRTDSENDDR